ncbi:UNVERIFIED_ORG: hypothetical protein ABIC54_004431 [Burkholderia sp. 1263]
MSATLEHHDGCTTCISDAGYSALAADQRDIQHDQQRAEILTWTVAGGLLCIAGLVILKILGG